MLIDQFIGYIQAEKRFSVLTVEAYQHDMLQFAGFMKDEFDIEDLTQVKTTMVKSYIVHLKEKGLVNRSINRMISTLRTFYKYCLRENLIEKTPMTGIKALKQPKPLVKFVSEADDVFFLWFKLVSVPRNQSEFFKISVESYFFHFFVRVFLSHFQTAMLS